MDAIQVRLIIRSPGLAYALNDFLEVLSHLQREYEVTRTTTIIKSRKSRLEHDANHTSANGSLMVHVVGCTYEAFS